MTFTADGKPTLERMLMGAAHSTAARDGCDVEQTPEWQALRELEAWRAVMPQFYYDPSANAVFRRPETLAPHMRPSNN